MSDWNKALNNRCCGGYYSPTPCRAKSCNLEHQYCQEHQKLLGGKIGKKNTNKAGSSSNARSDEDR